MFHIDHPFHFDHAGRTARTTWHDHAFDLLCQFLLTSQNERVNRPDFGSPLSRACFEGNSQTLSDVVQFAAQAGLQRWLGETVEVLQLDAVARDAVLQIDLKYRVRGEEEVRQAQRQVALPSGGAS